MSIIMSPTLYRNWRKCGRLAVLDSNRFLGNIHTVYGRAFEEGAKQLINSMTLAKEGKCPVQDDNQMAYLVGSAFFEANKLLLAFQKHDEHKEKNKTTLLLALESLYYWLDYFLTQNEVVQYEERIIYRSPTFDIGGAYDFRAKILNTNKSAIYDFKGITSFWRYSFPTDPQIPIYAVLKQMQLIEQGKKEVISLNSGYVVNLTSAKLKDEALQYIPVDTTFLRNNLTGIMSNFIAAAKELKRLQKVSSDNRMRYYIQAPINTTHCSSGNYDCYYKNECNPLRFDLKSFSDDRVFDSVYQGDFSPSLLDAAITRIKEGTSEVNLVEGSGIASGAELDEKDIEELFDDVSLWT
jgi:hypothetical protein